MIFVLIPLMSIMTHLKFVLFLTDGEAVSEEENSGEEEDLDALHKEAEIGETKSGKRKRKTEKGLTAR
jgi:hypothetical protein